MEIRTSAEIKMSFRIFLFGFSDFLERFFGFYIVRGLRVEILKN